MCRNIKTLFKNLSGYDKPSKANEAAFTLIDSLETSAEPRYRELFKAT
jgi:hypothetical protein